MRYQPRRISRLDGIRHEFHAWIKPVVLLALLLFAGNYLQIFQATPSYQAACRRYIEEYHPPVREGAIDAFVSSKEIHNTKPRAIFLTKLGLLFFNPNISQRNSALPEAPSQREIFLSLNNIASVQNEGGGFTGGQLMILGTHGERIAFEVSDKRLGDFFVHQVQRAKG